MEGLWGPRKGIFIAKNAISGLPDMGKIRPGMFENLDFPRFSDQLFHTQKYPTETHFLIFRCLFDRFRPI